MAVPTPRPELLSLLTAIKADPDDDTPKLVLADWLEEQDDPADRARGEYLREIVRYDALPWYDPGRTDIEPLDRLWKKHASVWFGRLAAVGFTSRSAIYASYAGLLVPNIDGTKLVSNKASNLVGTEEYAWVAGLSFRRISSGQVDKLASSPLLDSLIALHFHSCNAYSTSIGRLLNSPRAAGLKDLSLSKVPAPAEALASSPHLTGLKRLRMWFGRLSDARFKMLCDSPILNELQVLEASNNQLTIHSARALAERTGLPALTELDLGGTNHLGPEGTLILVSSPKMSQLRKLGLWSNGVGDSGVASICQQSHLNNLTSLDLSGNQLTNRAAVALASAEHLKTLETLDLKTNSISGEGALALANSTHLKNLKRLDLSTNRIGQKAADALRDRFGPRVVLD